MDFHENAVDTGAGSGPCQVADELALAGRFRAGSAGQLDAPQLGELFYFLELTAALCAAADGLNPFDRKRSSPTRAQAAALLRG